MLQSVLEKSAGAKRGLKLRATGEISGRLGRVRRGWSRRSRTAQGAGRECAEGDSLHCVKSGLEIPALAGDFLDRLPLGHPGEDLFLVPLEFLGAQQRTEVRVADITK